MVIKMIYIIISHDVDHLFSRDHWFRDLVYPKMWIRTSIQLVKREIKLSEWFLRNISCFRKNRHNLEAQMQFDEQYGVKPTYFFGMNQGLGMSYKPHEAKQMISRVYENGFDVGVHGIDYQSMEGIKDEYDRFLSVMGFLPCGIRMHYVRFNDKTFKMLNEIGYRFDCTEFDKKNCGTIKNPYKVGKMWEFPLTIMDGYLPQEFEKAKQKTLDILTLCKEQNIEYISVLFHDYQFCKDYNDIWRWYKWLIEFFANSKEYEFVSYMEAIRRLEEKND